MAAAPTGSPPCLEDVADALHALGSVALPFHPVSCSSLTPKVEH